MKYNKSKPYPFRFDSDFLRDRRLASGADSVELSSILDSRILLRRGLVRAAIVLVTLGCTYSLLVWHKHRLASEILALGAVPSQVKKMEGEINQLRLELNKVKTSNQGLVSGIMAVDSGSMLLADLFRTTPMGVQIQDVSVAAGSLQLKGIASDPDAFRRVNALLVRLADSAIFDKSTVKIIKVTRESLTASQPESTPEIKPSQAADVQSDDSPKNDLSFLNPLVSWHISAGFAKLTPAQRQALLNELGSKGLLRRIQILREGGVSL